MERRRRGERAELWARLRFSVIAPLLASPPRVGELGAEIQKLSTKFWKHPVTGGPVRFGRSTIERWYYRAKKAGTDPVSELVRRVRGDAGAQRSLSPILVEALCAQYREHPSWSYKLHADNLDELAKKRGLGRVPSVSTLARFMKSHGLFRVKRRGPRKGSEGAERATERFRALEVRSFEADHVHGLWHLDFHHGSRRVLTVGGRWETPILLGILDDRSRLACHVQWYLSESAESLVHGLGQAFQKRGLPRAILWDNGAAMRAEEVLEGLRDLGVEPRPALPYSPYQNGKQEAFWSVVEGRLMAMLEGEKELTLASLNEATLAWVESDYNRAEHSEIGKTPLERFLEGPDVGRECPPTLALRRAFRLCETRRQRRSDGTVAIEGRRFEVPSRLAHLESLSVRYARWDLSLVEVVDPRTRAVTARLYPVDLSKNADGRRRPREGMLASTPLDRTSSKGGMAPLLQRMVDEQRASGLPPAFLPSPERGDGKEVSS
jgi:transposase InsO family protein